jgi:hypothetical protein
VLADLPPVADLVRKVEVLSRSEQWQRDGGQYVPHPATWLRRGGWDDEPENGRPSTASRRTTHGAGGTDALTEEGRRIDELARDLIQ